MGIRIRGNRKDSTFTEQTVNLALGEGYWYFRVRILDGSGRASAWSSEGSRVVLPGGESVELTLNPPDPAVRTDGKPIYVITEYEIEYGQTSGALNLTYTHAVPQ